MKTDCDYGDLVQVSFEAPPRFMPGARGSVVSIYKVDKSPYADQLGVSVGTLVIGIEEEDGTFFEIPAHYVRKLDGQQGA